MLCVCRQQCWSYKKQNRWRQKWNGSWEWKRRSRQSFHWPLSRVLFPWTWLHTVASEHLSTKTTQREMISHRCHQNLLLTIFPEYAVLRFRRPCCRTWFTATTKATSTGRPYPKDVKREMLWIHRTAKTSSRPRPENRANTTHTKRNVLAQS